MNHNVRRKRNAFTLIELLLVLIILAVLAAVVVPKFTNRSEQAKVTAAKTDISNMETALDAYELDCGHYPTGDEGLQALVTNASNAQDWKGPYLKRLNQDPWGHPYVYVSPGQHNANGVDLYSLGPDGREGNDDITNWNQ